MAVVRTLISLVLMVVGGGYLIGSGSSLGVGIYIVVLALWVDPEGR